MDISSKRNITVGECVIDVQHDFQIDDFIGWMNHTIKLCKDEAFERLDEAKVWVGHSNDSYTAEDVDEYIEHLDKEYLKIYSLQIHRSKYINDGSKLKLLIEYGCDESFDNVEAFISECIDLIYKKRLYDMKQQNNLQFKEERISA